MLDACSFLMSTLSQVRNTGFAILHAAPEMSADREIALTAVRDRGFVLRYLKDSFKASARAVSAACSLSRSTQDDALALR